VTFYSFIHATCLRTHYTEAKNAVKSIAINNYCNVHAIDVLPALLKQCFFSRNEKVINENITNISTFLLYYTLYF